MIKHYLKNYKTPYENDQPLNGRNYNTEQNKSKIILIFLMSELSDNWRIV